MTDALDAADRVAACSRATRSTRTRPRRPRTPRRRRLGSCTRPPTRPDRPAPSTTSSCGACSRRRTERRCGRRFASCAPSGPRHEALPQTVALDPVAVAAVVDVPVQREVTTGGLTLGVRLSAEPLKPGAFEVALRVENRTACARGAGSRRRACPFPALHPPAGAGLGRPLQLAAGTSAAVHQHLPGAGHAGRRRRAGRGHRAPRPPPDRAREPRRSVRLDRDRGGVAAARADAHRRRARARSGRPIRPLPRWWRGLRQRRRMTSSPCTAG